MASENPEKPIGQQQANPDAQAETKNHSHKTDPPVMPVVVVSNTPPPTEKQCEITVNTKRDRIDSWTLRMEGFGLFVLIVYTIATIAIWCANKRAAEATRDSVTNADTNFRVGQRAWVGAWAGIVQRTNSETMDTIDYRVVLKNTGPTPALHVKVEPGFMFKERNYLVESDFAQGNSVFLNEDRLDKTSRYSILPNDPSYSPKYGFNVHHPPKAVVDAALLNGGKPNWL
jgi:hypothetical protein